MGAIFQTPRPPTLSHWPSASSMKYMGIPANIAVKKNGMRKAPERERERKIIVTSSTTMVISPPLES